MSEPRIWALLGHRRGDNNQVLALAEALGLPCTKITLRYGRWRSVDKYLKGRTLLSVAPAARAQLVPPWPDVVIGIGHRSVPAVLYIKRKSGGRTLTVRLGNPRVSPRFFDLTISPPQYRVPDQGHFVQQALTLGRPREALGPTAEEQAYLASLPRPHRLLALGGPVKGWILPYSTVIAAVETLLRRGRGEGGTLISVGSPRTDPALLERIAAVGDEGRRHAVSDGHMPRFGVLLDDADEIYVTGDSISMLSEAIMAGKPVGMIPATEAPRGPGSWLKGWVRARRGAIRDLPRTWAAMREAGLIGTVDAPLKGPPVDPVDEAAEAVKALMRDRGML
ncbi:MAG: mitochondrial fission ELM1 family protein [Pseudomonadota bacterium]|nr:mitochondrial fission ELM1 family protein [Pseudomonadota bacterium]